MKTIFNDNFLLHSEPAEFLYHEVSKNLPIIDYHCHLSPSDLENDIQFENLTKIWLDGDHYKWRVLRANGVSENYITGEASDWEKFLKWAETVPNTLRNPLFHWTHLELQRYFGIDEYLDGNSAKHIYDAANERLNTTELSARRIPMKMGVEVICTTDDPIDNLEHHLKLKSDGYEVKVLPTFRPDNCLKIDNSNFVDYLEKLGSASDVSITSIDDLIKALKIRIDFFDSVGCRLSDHGLSRLHSGNFDHMVVNNAIQKKLSRKTPNANEANQYKSYVLYMLGKMYHEKGWVQQFHLGALRNTNTRLGSDLGADAGVDSIGDYKHASDISRYLDRLDLEKKLSKTILYNLNPADNEVFATMAGNFQDGEQAGKIQWGSGWWYLDQKDGMEKQINALSNMGLLSQFVGMLTDSRSLLSYPRHEYFRRILCNLVGQDVVNGELPNDMDWLGGMIKNICYGNAKRYFDF